MSNSASELLLCTPIRRDTLESVGCLLRGGSSDGDASAGVGWWGGFFRPRQSGAVGPGGPGGADARRAGPGAVDFAVGRATLAAAERARQHSGGAGGRGRGAG